MLALLPGSARCTAGFCMVCEYVSQTWIATKHHAQCKVGVRKCTVRIESGAKKKEDTQV